MRCLNCDTEFEQTRIDKVYCSRNCKCTARKKRKGNPYYVRVAAKHVKPVFSLIYAGYCEYCKKPFVSKHKSKYCSPNCRHNTYKTHLKREKDRLRRFYTTGRGAIKECTCPTCGVVFKTNNKRKYCTTACGPNYSQPWDNSTRICINCSKGFTPKRKDQKYCSTKCNPYRKNTIDKYYLSKEWKSIRAEFIRYVSMVDGWPLPHKYCFECFRKTGTRKPMYAVDHIIPRRLGGSDEFNNLQSLCRFHHQSKSAVEGNSIRLGEKRLNYRRHAHIQY